jgi:ABC-type arginine/histidine transport system permease subunit
MNSSKSMRHLVDEFKVNGRSLALLSLTLALTMVIQIQIALFTERQNGTFKWRMTAHFFWRAPFLVNTFALDDHGKEEDV